MPTGAIIALVGAIAGFLGIGLYIAIKGRDIRWPKGKYVRDQIGRYKVRLIISPGTDLEVDTDRLARVCAVAAQSVVEAWKTVYPEDEQKVQERMKHVGVWLLSDDEYDDLDGPDEFMDESNGTVTHASRIIGSSIPIATVRAKFVPDIMKHGGVVLHEFVHIANRARGSDGNIWTDVRHENDRIWDNIQSKARELVRRKV